MKFVRHILALGGACVAGALIPVLATLYDSLYRYKGSEASAWSDPRWRVIFIWDASCIAGISIIVGLIAGGIGVWWLRAQRRTSFKAYALSGLGIGALCGFLLAGVSVSRTDPAIAWLIFFTLPTISMTLGFVCYWLINGRHQAA